MTRKVGRQSIDPSLRKVTRNLTFTPSIIKDLEEKTIGHLTSTSQKVNYIVEQYLKQN